MKRALCVGIDYYKYASQLYGCAQNAGAISWILQDKNYNGCTTAFETCVLCSKTPDSSVTQDALRDCLYSLYDAPSDITLLYFSGHIAHYGHGAYLCTSDTEEWDDGFSLEALLNLAACSRAPQNVIFLDCSYSDFISFIFDTTIIPSNTTILLSNHSSSNPYPNFFSPLLVTALQGSAKNVLGEVTVESIYSYMCNYLDKLDQHPILKSNVDRVSPLIKYPPSISFEEIRLLTKYFYTPTMKYRLDPSYDFARTNAAIYSLFHKYYRHKFLIPVGEDSLFLAAQNSKACELTPLGQYFWRLVKQRKI